MTNFIKNFRADESGAVTVDWVVLTAAVVGLGIVVMTTIGGGIKESAESISTNLSTATSQTEVPAGTVWVPSP